MSMHYHPHRKHDHPAMNCNILIHHVTTAMSFQGWLVLDPGTTRSKAEHIGKKLVHC